MCPDWLTRMANHEQISLWEEVPDLSSEAGEEDEEGDDEEEKD